jgi:hypothetical protein
MEVHLLQYILQKMQFLFTTEQPTMSSINPVYLGAKQGAAGVQISQDSATFCIIQVTDLIDITRFFCVCHTGGREFEPRRPRQKTIRGAVYAAPLSCFHPANGRRAEGSFSQ